MMQEKEVQQKYLEYQLLEQQIQQIRKHLQMTEEQTIEVIYTQQSLDELKTTKKDTEILVPISNGIFAKAKLIDQENLIVNVGCGTVVKKTIAATKEMLGKQLKEIQEMQSQLVEAQQKLEEQMVATEQILSEMIKSKG